MSNILVLSGRKGSGKNTSANALVANEFCNLGFAACINNQGQLMVGTEVDGNMQFGLFDLDDKSPVRVKFLSEEIWPYVKTYSYADYLKEICMKLFGLTHEQCYGTDEQKNTPTALKWENMPAVYNTENIPKYNAIMGRWLEDNLLPHKNGIMTAREVLQFFGTQICRRMAFDCWVNATIHNINVDSPALAIITDCRFPNEVLKIKEAGGKVIRFTRNPYNDDHASEHALDKEKFDWNNFDAVVENDNMSIQEQCDVVMNKLIEWGWYNKVST